VTGADAVSELGGDDSSVGHDWAFPVLVFDSLGARRNDSPFKVSR
jgi:hypothetical protein